MIPSHDSMTVYLLLVVQLYQNEELSADNRDRPPLLRHLSGYIQQRQDGSGNGRALNRENNHHSGSNIKCLKNPIICN